MQSNSKPTKGTATTNGRLWGAQASDWANIQEGQCRPVFTEAFERVQLSARHTYLDAGCGSGMAAQIAAEHGVKVSGLDAAENLLKIAKSRVPDGIFHLGELENLPFPDDSFDLVTGFNSFQYARNPLGALAEAKRVAKPGARVLIATWGPPEGMQAASLISAIKPLLPTPPAGTPGPFALSDENALREFATKAELTPVEVFDVLSDWSYPNKDTALRGLKSAGVAIRAIEHSSEEAVDKAYAEALGPFQTPGGGYKIEAKFRCLLTLA